MKPKEYKIKTVQDIIDCTNKSNLDNFLTDFRKMLEMAHAFRELSKSLAEIAGLPREMQEIESKGFVWIDDGKHDSKVTIGVK